LHADDLQLWATAAYLLGQPETAVDAMARAFQEHRVDVDVPAALRCGVWVVFILLNNGDEAQAGGWLARCGRLLSQLPSDSPEHGYMLCVTALRLAAVERKYGDAQASADRVAEIGRNVADEDLVALGLNVAGPQRYGPGWRPKASPGSMRPWRRWSPGRSRLRSREPCTAR
jgi:hypothetical protein